MAIGLPGSGKTTVLKPFAEKHGLAYISRDDLREEILGDVHNQSANKVIWEEANRRTAAALAAGTGVVLDSTFVERWKRLDMLEFLREHGATHLIGVYADVPVAVAKERNRGRAVVVPDSVIERMHGELTKNPPRLEEGYDRLITLDELQGILG